MLMIIRIINISFSYFAFCWIEHVCNQGINEEERLLAWKNNQRLRSLLIKIILVLRRFCLTWRKFSVLLTEKAEGPGSTLNWGSLLGSAASSGITHQTFWRGTPITKCGLINCMFVLPLLSISSLCFPISFLWFYLILFLGPYLLVLLFHYSLILPTLHFLSHCICALITFHLFFVPSSPSLCLWLVWITFFCT